MKKRFFNVNLTLVCPLGNDMQEGHGLNRTGGVTLINP